MVTPQSVVLRGRASVGTHIHSAYPVTTIVTERDEAQHTFLEVYVVLIADCASPHPQPTLPTSRPY